MIINKDFYRCNNCPEMYSFDTSKPFSTKCPVCGEEMEFRFNGDCDTERAARVAEEMKQKGIKPASPYKPKAKPVVTCPYCSSTNTRKISGTSKAVSVGLFGIFSTKIHKQWHCNNCKSDF